MVITMQYMTAFSIYLLIQCELLVISSKAPAPTLCCPKANSLSYQI